MTDSPIAVTADTTYKQLAGLMALHRISAIPIVDEAGVPVGVVSESDLLARFRHPRASFISGRHSRAELRKANGLLAKDLMTAPVLTVGGGESVDTAAALLARKQVRRLFVVEDGKLTGVVSRRDLLSSFQRPDEEIRFDIERDVLADTLWVTPGQASVTVEDGVVTLLGRLDNRGTVERAGALVADVAGVVEVRNRLDFVWDDETIRHAALGI
ncbi:CBS domain-containing protein [Amycolatopsis sp. WAC 01376]|uniref:CBS domain-containing protein n=1 Tax=Amycolatopsis sp. WAC 01376 TaxID=2203195 RepID=UPI001F3BA482|nr:CBS domain-containing protein [Amycolatopsis sp. WAC 01376]